MVAMGDAPRALVSVGHDRGMCTTGNAGDDASRGRSFPVGHDSGICKAGFLGDDAARARSFPVGHGSRSCKACFLDDDSTHASRSFSAVACSKLVLLMTMLHAQFYAILAVALARWILMRSTLGL